MPTSEIASPSVAQPSQGLWIAILGDMVASRRLAAPRRRSAQEAFLRLMRELNEEFAGAIAAQFAITQGDEFECLLRTETAGESIPDILWRIEERFRSPAIRFGIGLGSVDTVIPIPPESAIVLDGPAFHRAREAVRAAAKEKKMGGIFLGFGTTHDAILNGLARLLERQRRRWSRRQREVALLLRSGVRQAEIARRTRRKPQAVSTDTRAAGWYAYREGEQALRLAIREAISAQPPAPAAALPGTATAGDINP